MRSVLVGIPTLNGPDRLQRCLDSIAECTPDLTGVKVLVCDDGSTEDNLKLNKDAIQRAERLRERAGLEMLINAGRMGISKSWNRLARHEPHDVVILLNDDVEVVNDWLDVLVYSVAENKHLGMVSLNAYVGVTKGQLAAVCPDLPEHVRSPRIDYREARLLDGGGSLLASNGFAFAFRREVYDIVGGFDERYFCYYEELDLGVSMIKRGYRHAIASYPIVYHMGGATTSDEQNMNAQTQMLISRGLFLEKWGTTPEHIRREVTVIVPATRTWNTQLKHLKD